MPIIGASRPNHERDAARSTIRGVIHRFGWGLVLQELQAEASRYLQADMTATDPMRGARRVQWGKVRSALYALVIPAAPPSIRCYMGCTASAPEAGCTLHDACETCGWPHSGADDCRGIFNG